MTKATELREFASLLTVASGQIQFDTDIKISGDLITTGNTINITADTLNISDPNITLASGAANSAIADGAGITIDGADATLTWNDSSSRMDLNRNLYINSGANTSSTSRLTIESDGYSGLLLLSDATNASGEPGGAFVKLFADASGTGGILSFVQESGEDGAGGSFQDTNGNSILLGNYADLPVQFGTNGSVWMTVSRSGTEPRIGMGTISPQEVLHLRGDAPNVLIDNTTETESKIRFLDNQSAGSQYYDIVFNSGGSNPANPVTHKYVSGSIVTTQTWSPEGKITISSTEPIIHLETSNSNKQIYLRTENAGGSVYWGKDDDVGTATGSAYAGWISVSGANQFYIKQNNANSFSLRENASIYSYNDQPTIRPTLNLDFTKSKKLDPLLSFNRDTIATYTDDRGYIRYASENEPRFDHDMSTGESKGLLLEESRTNGYAFTTFDDAATYWSIQGYTGGKNPLVRRKAAVAPDGTHSALEVYFDNTGGDAYRSWVRKCNVGANISQDVRMSFWIKSATGSNQNLRWHSGGNIGDTITVTSEWQRFVWEGANNLSYCWGLEGPMNATAHVYIWGAQIEAGAFETSYIPSENFFTSRSSRATYYDENGIIRSASVNEPRYGYMWDGEKFVETGLIIESGRTNIISHGGYESSQNTITYTGTMTKTLHYDTAPDGSDETVRFTFSNGYAYRYYPNVLGDSTPVAVSFYFKLYSGTYLRYAAGGSFGSMGVRLYADGTTVWDSPQANTIVQWARVYPVGNGWYRGEVIFQSSGTSGYTELQWSGAPEFGLWGLQVEDNSWEASSFIYSGSTTTTRSADIVYSNALTRGEDRMGIYTDAFNNGWYNQKESTWYTEFSTKDAVNDGGYTTVIHVEGETDGGGANRYGMFAHPSNYGNPEWFSSTGGGNFDIYSTSSAYTTAGGTYRKAAGTYKLNDIAFYVDGVQIGTDTTASPIIIADTVTFGGRLANQLGGITGHFKKIAYYPERLPNAELQALTEND